VDLSYRQDVHPAQLTFAVPLLASGAVSFAIGVLVPRRYDTRGTRSFAHVFFVVGLLGVVGAVHVLFAGSRAVVEGAAALELALAAAGSVLWFVFATEYANRSIADRPVPRAALGGFLVVAVVLPVTNPLHGFVFESFAFSPDPFPHYEVAKGPGHYLIAVPAYLPVLAGAAVLVRLLRSTRFLSRSVGAVLVGVAALVGANALPYLADLPLEYNPMYMPLGGVVFSAAVASAIHFNLFSVTPVARQRVVTAIRDPIVTLDKNRRVVDVNPAFVEAFTDADSGSSIAHEPFEVAVPDLAESVSIDDPERQTVRVESSDGHGTSHYTVSASPVESGPHRIGYTLVFRDVTDVVESRRELERQNEQLDEFAVSAAHNLRNPLGAISGFLDVLESHLRTAGVGDSRYDADLVERCLARLDTEADRMDDIIADFLRVMREGKTVQNVEPVDVASTARSAVGSVGYDRISLVVARPGRVWAEPSRFELLLRTVFRSAHDRADGSVTVRVAVTDDGFVVEDDAGELPPEDAEMLLEHGRMSAYDVTGLGLIVARTLAGVHRWEADAVPGEAGLRFVVTGAETLIEADGPSLAEGSASPELDVED
jgi:PAS domain-containing protein